MYDFKVTLNGNHFEFFNFDTLIQILENRSILFPEELRVFTFHCDVLVPQPFERPPEQKTVRLRSLLVDLATRVTEDPNVKWTVIFKIDPIEAVAGTELFEIALHFLEDGTYFGYDLPTAFPNTILQQLEMEFRIFKEKTNHQPIEHILLVN